MWGTDYPWLFSDNLNNKCEEIVTYSDEMIVKKKMKIIIVIIIRLLTGFRFLNDINWE